MACLFDGLGRRPAPRLLLRAGGAFPHPERARVLWVGLEQHGGTPLLELHRAARAAAAATPGLLAGDGRAQSTTAFHPHVTVARPRRTPFAVPQAFLTLDFEEPWTPDELVLLESVRDGAGSPRYPVLARADFLRDRP